MNVKLKDVLTRSFWLWLIATVAMVLVIIIVPQSIYPLCGMIMATFILLPVRDWCYRTLVWAIDYVSSVNTPFKDRVHPHLTYNRLLEPSKRYQNDGVYRAIKFVISLTTIILALLWMIFQSAAVDVVYSWLHTLEFLFTGKLSWLALLFYVLSTIAFWYLVYWSLGIVLNGKLYQRIIEADGTEHFVFDHKHAWGKILIMIVGFYAKIILSAILLKYTLSMACASLKFWTVVVGLPIITFIAGSKLWKRYKSNHNS